MRKYPEIYVQWTPASGISSQDFQVTVPGLTPSGEPYIQESLSADQQEWSGFVPLWNRDGIVWSEDYGTDNVTITVTSVNEVNDEVFMSEPVASLLYAENLAWVPSPPEEIRPSLSSFLVEVDDSFMEHMEVSVQQNLSIITSKIESDSRRTIN